MSTFIMAAALASELAEILENPELLQLLIKGLTTICLLLLFGGAVIVILSIWCLVRQLRYNKDYEVISKCADFIASGLFAILFGTWGYAIFTKLALINIFYDNLWLFCLTFTAVGILLLFLRHRMPEIIKRVISKKQNNKTSGTEGEQQ